MRDDKNNKNMKIVRFKNAAVKIPSEILDEVILMIESLISEKDKQPTKNNVEIENAFKDGVVKLKKLYQRQANITNIESIANSSSVTPRLTHLTASSAAARLTSTPANKKKNEKQTYYCTEKLQ